VWYPCQQWVLRPRRVWWHQRRVQYLWWWYNKVNQPTVSFSYMLTILLFTKIGIWRWGARFHVIALIWLFALTPQSCLRRRSCARGLVLVHIGIESTPRRQRGWVQCNVLISGAQLVWSIHWVNTLFTTREYAAKYACTRQRERKREGGPLVLFLVCQDIASPFAYKRLFTYLNRLLLIEWESSLGAAWDWMDGGRLLSMGAMGEKKVVWYICHIVFTLRRACLLS
jgi:hypothetical protein